MNVDPNGNFFWFIFIGAAIGVVAGGTVSGITAYNNGARGWDLVGAIFSGILAGGVVGGLVGATVWALPTLGSFGASGLALAGGGTVATSTVIETTATLLGALILFARIGKIGGYKIDHHYPNDHDPKHVHISGDDIVGGKTKVDLDGNPLPGQSPLSLGARKAFKKLYKKIIQALLPWM